MDLRARRVAAGISGEGVCRVAGFSRSKLSNIERENLVASLQELQRIDTAINQIIQNRHRVTQLAMEAGLSLTGVRL
jgi:transcriptional regulator with XRE-family HTH domain